MSAGEVSQPDGAGAGSLLGSYAERLTARANAPAQQNLALLGCRICGTATVSRAGDEVTITARRAPAFMQALYITTLLLFVFAMVVVILMALPLMPWARSAVSFQSDVALLNQAGIVAAVFFVLNRAVAAFAGRGAAEDLRLPASDLLATTIGWRRRNYLLQGPLGAGGKNRRLVLESASDADNELLRRILPVGAR